jgi:hypothetical protein
MKSHVFLFQERFAQAVIDGKKLQTIRLFRKRMPAAGDLIDLRKWSGLPYRSQQVRLAIAPCLSVANVTIRRSEIDVWYRSGESSRHILDKREFLDLFAQADGFENFADMVKWFESTHQLPFLGMRVQWGKFIVPNAHSIIP